MTCRRQTDATSRSISSGAARTWPRRPRRAASPSEVSSARAGAKTLASTTITILPEDLGRRLDRHSTAGPSAGALEDLLDRGRGCFLDQLGSQVLLQRLMSRRRSLTQHCVGVLWDVLDLHARHGAIMALRAPSRNRTDSSARHPGCRSVPGHRSVDGGSTVNGWPRFAEVRGLDGVIRDQTSWYHC